MMLSGTPGFVADTSTMTPARARALASPIIQNWVEKSGQQLVTRIRQEPPGGLAATGLAACLTAVRQHAVHILAMPGQGLVPGFACRRCGAVGATAAGCAHPGSAAFAVPDLIDEIAVSTLHDGGQVQAGPARPVESPPGSGSRSDAAAEPSHDELSSAAEISRAARNFSWHQGS